MGCELSSGSTVVRLSSACDGARKGKEGAVSSCGKMGGEIVEEDLRPSWMIED